MVMETYQNYIGGKITPSYSEKKFPLYNPTSGNQTGEVALSSKEDLKQAVEVAKAAFPIWASKTPLTRARVMMKFCSLISDNTDELAKILSNSHGKVFADAKGEIVRGLEVAEFSIAAPHLLKGEHSMNVGTGVEAGLVLSLWVLSVALLLLIFLLLLKPSEKAAVIQTAGLPDEILIAWFP